ncbi:hypothetical protein TCAL_05915 [Tigriopus californicus]|uniref:RING-type E3 ubiquitin transferase n=1 Tax=Tigriopus californicus TaxID=6832 RepID=A0A553PN14_TIGCA|nr:E3 ubiquitin-protein ligase RNF13-like [Tigriopus californicus]TRY79078.1 hypothetical protein TCAL_05915 [Tigriopus californicus]|eukprot:TCALIF_05915-PA protein Name:"Similar to RNF13 E3 ubiquitin-protein ligase RNF13 (Gallus gallus)" AED:0.05 eAED:0.06 QI:0/-1/0/1/-1/1/1/0/399
MTIPGLKLGLVMLLVSLTRTVVKAEVLVFELRTGHELRSMPSAPAQFGRAFPDEGISGWVMKANPINACQPIEPPIGRRHDGLQYFALISRNGCSFETKIRYAQKANFSAAIVFNPNSDRIIPMGGSDASLIPSLFIGRSDSNLLQRHYLFPSNPDVYLLLTDDDDFDINAYLLPFAIVIGVCFTIMLSIVLYKCIQDHRRSRRHRLPRSALKRLPIIKFKTSDPYETCCICLEDFEEGEKLRILPCDHGYHSKCIDPWLVKNKRICPQCRKRVFGGDESAEEETDDERAPLLANGARTFPSYNHGRPFSTAAESGGLQTFAERDAVPPQMLAAAMGQVREVPTHQQEVMASIEVPLDDELNYPGGARGGSTLVNVDETTQPRSGHQTSESQDGAGINV